MRKILKVARDQNGKRLDLFIAQAWNKFNRSRIKKIIESNNVTVNDEVQYRSNYSVRTGDNIIINYDNTQETQKFKPEKIDLDIIYEDDDLVAINKPYGMVVHPATGNYTGTLANALAYRDSKGVFDDHRHGLINRIDKETSGVVLAGKTNEALWFYTKQFAERIPQKVYVAVVERDFSQVAVEHSYVVQNYIMRNPIKRKKFSSSKDNKGKLARTSFQFLDYSPKSDSSLILAMPETGRTHQIRVHLSELGYPIIGDTIYSGRKYKRLLLHSHLIRLKSKVGELLLEAPFDPIFKDYLLKNFKYETVRELFNKKEKKENHKK